MDLQQFTKDAIRTESQIASIKTDAVTLKRVLEILTSAGNLLDMIKKNVFYSKPIDSDKWNAYSNQLVEVSNALNRGEYVGLQHPEEIAINPRIFHGIIGMATESTELLEALLSVLNGENIDAVNIGEELFDTCWYIAILMDTLGFEWDPVLDAGIKKLKARYPEKFDSSQAINRNLDVERNVLEQNISK